MTDKPMALRFQIELVFEEMGKQDYPEENLLEQGENQKQTQLA